MELRLRECLEMNCLRNPADAPAGVYPILTLDFLRCEPQVRDYRPDDQEVDPHPVTLAWLP